MFIVQTSDDTQVISIGEAVFIFQVELHLKSFVWGRLGETSPDLGKIFVRTNPKFLINGE
jgi:hypothetical protein